MEEPHQSNLTSAICDERNNLSSISKTLNPLQTPCYERRFTRDEETSEVFLREAKKHRNVQATLSRDFSEEKMSTSVVIRPTDSVKQAAEMKAERFFSLLGPLREHLDNELTQNIVVNEDGSIFIERFGADTVNDTMDRPDRIALISYLANAQLGGSSIDHLHPRLQADMPYYNARIQALAPPIADWSLIIRVHAKSIFTLQEYVASSALQKNHEKYLKEAIASELNIAIAGNVNSGKTTFLNACLAYKAEIFPRLRPIIVQDRREIQADGFCNRLSIIAKVELANVGQINSGRTIYNFSDALEDALRANGDFLVWGEVRDGASAHGLAMATNTGSRGLLMTTHANSCIDTLYRLEDLLRSDGWPPVRRMIARMIQVIVYMERDQASGQRRVVNVQCVKGVDDNDQYVVTEVP